MKSMSLLLLSFCLLVSRPLPAQTTSVQNEAPERAEPIQVDAKAVAMPGRERGTLLSVLTASAQEPNGESQEPTKSQLPDTPKPKQKKDSDYDDRVYETRVWWHEPGDPYPAWWHALRDVKFLAGVATLSGLTVTELIQTQKCIDSRKQVCNLFFGKNQGANYAVNIPLTATIVWGAARMKEREHPTSAVFMVLGGLIYQTISTVLANPRVVDSQTSASAEQKRSALFLRHRQF